MRAGANTKRAKMAPAAVTDAERAPRMGSGRENGRESEWSAAPGSVIDWERLRRFLGGFDLRGGAFPAGPFAEIAVSVLAGKVPERREARRMLGARGRELGYLLGATLVVRVRYFGHRVKVCVLENARSGLCGEDCQYCSQSAVSTASVDRYRLRSPAQLLAAARRVMTAGGSRFCMVASGRGPSEGDVDCFVEAARAIRAESDIELCVSTGLMSIEHARRLRAAGVGWVNHNLNTSSRFHAEICSTHAYGDRIATLRNVRRAGMAVCSGVIMGMGENDDDLIDVAEALRGIGVESLPVNFLHAIDGTPLGGHPPLCPERALAGLCLFRLFNPESDVRAAGGREQVLGALQPLAFYAANSIFADGYLTTPGQGFEQARLMIEAMGFVVESDGNPPAGESLDNDPRRGAEHAR